MPVLVVVKFAGDPDQLVAAIHEHVDPVMSRVAPEMGAQWHSLSTAPDGVLVVDIWESADAANNAMARPEVQEAMRAAGVSEPRADFYELVDHTGL